ncbi:type II toxin-antitoxin system Phd/YefM family antitoxin [Sphingobium fluviale]|uniref:Antitoxin n=1 Tax=Sphingobium fluviale TaxID=2506423 RepID=A0A4Q1KEH4_9SPHN|nr:type II toxin-antitoxin system Phd/YefM family antitoxin [Sphingobium fluviale]RXR27595.1 type II toxin-antitoxin system Phd/YefM family antitoxin [Sphingobium fluviale]
MGITTLSSREFNQDTSRAKKAATAGPVFITDRGKPAHVLLTIDEYRRLRGERGTSLLQALTPKNPSQDFNFDPPKLGRVSKPADLD